MPMYTQAQPIRTAIPQMQLTTPLRPPGNGMTLVGSESVFDSLRWADFYEQHKTKILAGGAAAAALLFWWFKYRR